jgi:hypothetical protein
MAMPNVFMISKGGKGAHVGRPVAIHKTAAKQSNVFCVEPSSFVSVAP